MSETPNADAIVGHDGGTWPATGDGMAWAIAFNRQFPLVAVDDALGWFCNAIMGERDRAVPASRPASRPALDVVAREIASSLYSLPALQDETREKVAAILRRHATDIGWVQCPTTQTAGELVASAYMVRFRGVGVPLAIRFTKEGADEVCAKFREESLEVLPVTINLEPPR